MTDLLTARLQMAFFLAFHILFAVAGMAMPLLMIIAEGLWLRGGDRIYLELAKRWAKAVAILFAVGAVTGTVLSFQLGILWPSFMEFAGPVIGMPFSLEGFAFFLEAIFLGIYLYGWERVSPKIHWFAGFVILFSGTASAVIVVTVNAWMNTPVGFEITDGRVTHVDPLAAMLSPAAFTQALHMVVAAFQAVGFAVAGIHALMLLKEPGNTLHRKAFAIALSVGAVAALAAPLSGDLSAKHLAKHQPVKFAAMEGQWETQKGAPLRIGGWPDEDAETTRYALEIPYALSFMAHMDPHAEVMGLKAVPREDRPPVAVVHMAFQFMVAVGTFMMGVGILGGWLAWRRRRIPDERWYLRLVVLCAPLGLLAIEAGWTVTEVGRQPWIIQGVMRTSEAVTPNTGLMAPFMAILAVYLFLAFAVFIALRRQLEECSVKRRNDASS